ncbi:MAG: divergent polysaccharide deacetylase family protein [Alphaproteobacteria bacterium]|nr:divergent polysaccharide deacetylase family protein [Alphaproteobacteria bacterium]
MASPLPPPGRNGTDRRANARRQVSILTLVIVLVVAFVVLAALIIWLGDPDAGEPKVVLKVEPHPQVPAEVVAQTPQTPTGPAPSSSAALIAANGIVITDPALTEQTNDGPVPIIAADGRRPMDLYARPFDRTDPRPKIAIVVAGLGIGEAITQSAIDKLPPAVTLSFTPYGTAGLQSSVSAARAAGHEVLLELPMEPFDYPSNDPGPNTLMTGSAAMDNPQHLQWLMSRISGYAGVMNMQGAKFLSVPQDLRPILEQTKRRGLYFLDDGSADRSVVPETAQTAQAPFARADSVLDRVPSREGVELELKNLEVAAKTRGVAIGVATANPMTIDRITAWAADLEQRGLALAPVSAIITSDQATPTLPAEIPAPEEPRPPAQMLPSGDGSQN